MRDSYAVTRLTAVVPIYKDRTNDDNKSLSIKMTLQTNKGNLLKSLCPRLFCHPGITTTSVKYICPPHTSKALVSSDNSRKILLNSISAFHNSISMFLLHLKHLFCFGHFWLLKLIKFKVYNLTIVVF